MDVMGLIPLLLGVALAGGLDERQVVARNVALVCWLMSYAMVMLDQNLAAALMACVGGGVTAVALRARLEWTRGRVGRR